MLLTRFPDSFGQGRDRFGVALIYCVLCFVVAAAFVGPVSRAQNPESDVSNLLANP